jgi:hypothetical protein
MKLMWPKGIRQILYVLYKSTFFEFILRSLVLLGIKRRVTIDLGHCHMVSPLYYGEWKNKANF